MRTEYLFSKYYRYVENISKVIYGIVREIISFAG